MKVRAQDDEFVLSGKDAAVEAEMATLEDIKASALKRAVVEVGHLSEAAAHLTKLMRSFSGGTARRRRRSCA